MRTQAKAIQARRRPADGATLRIPILLYSEKDGVRRYREISGEATRIDINKAELDAVIRKIRLALEAIK